jgi:hypothetical protein
MAAARRARGTARVQRAHIGAIAPRSATLPLASVR